MMEQTTMTLRDISMMYLGALVVFASYLTVYWGL